MRLLDDWRVLVILVAAAVAIVLTGVGRPAAADSSASAIVRVSDPVDGWLDQVGASSPLTAVPAGVDGDLVLATAVAGAVAVEAFDGGLRFIANGSDARDAQLNLATALAAYEAARVDLRLGLKERLEMVPQLVRFVDERTADVRTTHSGLAGMSESDVVVEELANLPAETLRPLWVSTPVTQRLEQLDVVLAAAFWNSVESGR